MADVAAPSAPAHDADGRRRRSQDSRARIVQAMLELVHAGETSPPAELVADRAKVGLRTVFRHFNEMDSLYREMSAVIEAELQSVIARPFKAKDWKGRVVELVQRRASAYERIAPFRRAADVHRLRSPVLEADHARFAALGREILRRELPPEAARDKARFEALDMLLSFEAWVRLRRDQGLSAKRTVEALELAVAALVDPI
ncbi:TetR/AcrR family transcriptional regulator [Phenylobacterium sp.]|uniref:TetR/AcrR family transcriptional regulator n=1 Tax=Phenylobacterium sp. TaxID=1871053 RepID=UPI002730E81F|nr:TetR/AcrR family transcriptional regulator [Phenylobacterium sp.]MDP1615934.1 TetR/AcrR family transcriptional regulator [Phenylobacterium sp.]MDP1988711.1 TetR/AcrR family transcriptional regulator [Phenylobacterium sp.]